MLGPACPPTPGPSPDHPRPGPQGTVCTEVLAWLPHSEPLGGLGHREASEDRRVPPCSLPMLTWGKGTQAQSSSWEGAHRDGLGSQATALGLGQHGPQKAFLRADGQWGWAVGTGAEWTPPGEHWCARGWALPGDRLEVLEAARSRDL